jgi:hypothetical protein
MRKGQNKTGLSGKDQIRQNVTKGEDKTAGERKEEDKTACERK